MLCSAWLRRAAERFAHSARLISDSVAVSLDHEGEGMCLSMDLRTGGRPPIYQTIDTMLVGFFLLCEWIVNRKLHPISVRLQHAAPSDASAFRAVAAGVAV